MRVSANASSFAKLPEQKTAQQSGGIEMSLTLELPEPLSTELNEEASREGVSATDHATFLLYIATALHDTGKTKTPFQNAIKSFLASRSIDPNQLSTVFDDLVDYCLVPTGAGKTLAALSLPKREAGGDQQHSAFFALGTLVDWRNAGVHLGNTTMSSSSDGNAISEFDARSEWPEDFLESTYGSLADEPLNRLTQGDYDERVVVE